MHLDPLTLVALLPLLVWAALLAARGGFWRTPSLRLPTLPAPSRAYHVAAIIPARDEAAVIARSVASLLAGASPDSLHVYLVDDGSSDGTADQARAAADSLGKTSCLTLIPSTPPPPGWSGKLWAMQQGIAGTANFRPDYLLLTDADIVHSAPELAALLTLAERDACDLASLMVRLHCRTVPEKLLIPAFVFFFFSLYPPRWIAQPRARTAGAAGGCILVRPQALERAGGLAAIRNQIIDDCALARAVKRSGGKLWLGLAGDALSIRPYGSFAEIGHMIARTAFNQLQHSLLWLALALLSLILAFILPVAVLFTRELAPAALGTVTLAAMALAYLPMVRYYRLSPLWALTLPFAAVFYMGATLQSAANFWSGAGGRWKGRVQDPSP